MKKILVILTLSLFFFSNVASGTATVHGGTEDGAFMDGFLISRTA